jgi:CheY-like chemotaxis protein
LCRIIRAVEINRIKGIALTAYTMEDGIRKGREAGFSEHP